TAHRTLRHRWPRARPPIADDDPAAAPNSRHCAWAALIEARLRYRRARLPAMRWATRLLAAVEDPDGIRAILAALPVSRARADRAPRFAASVDASVAITA